MSTELPQVDDQAPRRRSTAKKPAAPKKPAAAKVAAPKVPADPANDLQVRDQLARAQQAREAAMRATAVAEPLVPAAPEVSPQALTVAPAPQPVAAGAMLVDQSLVNILKTVKSTSMADFESFLQELQPLVTLWHAAPHEAAARRHALSILLLIKERF